MHRETICSDLLSLQKPCNPTHAYTKLIMRSSQVAPRRQTVHTTVLLILCIFLTNPPLVSVQAHCRTSAGMPICCRGKQTTCVGYIQEPTESPIPHLLPHGKTIMRPVGGLLLNQLSARKYCYCDEHCTTTNDCCPDYREVCSKPIVDCEVSNWGPWTECDRQCGRGTSVRRRRVVQQAVNGGRYCPVLEESKPCQGHRCSFRRVGRSGALMIPFMHQARAEVAHLLPMKGDVLRMTRRWDMRWDVRRKLYLGRLIKQNKTEKPEPDPYCVVYEITHANPACRTHNLLSQFIDGNKAQQWPQPQFPGHYIDSYMNRPPTDTYLFDRSPYSYNGHRRARQVQMGRFSSVIPSDSYWGSSDSWAHAWMTHAALLTEGQHICVTCYAGYMREDFGFRCTGTGLLNVETRWRALRTADCQGRFRMVNIPQRACTCGKGAASFIFV
ncbi:hypothetical protein P879_00877 [Paragonimus westermani]|uniref:SMB domain-containing protein n=1 Tax=Paragonimus westermani TaxID=34504 RepID=A0A8T0DP70_9TREM|nr:hypothetical protein P879_00877 [Paragonimus westermani]